MERMENTESFDLIVIGAGSGLDVAVGAAARGMKVAIIEEGPLGGTCLNRGCIPSKILIHAADVIQTINHAKTFGITVPKPKINFRTIMSRARVVDKDAAEIEENLLKAKNITLFKGRAVFRSQKTLRIGTTVITGNKIVISAGTRPTVPPIEGLMGKGTVPYITSDQALRLDSLPKHLIIVGGGYIACELAHFYGSMGSKITILQRNVRLLPDEDEEVGLKFTELFSKFYDVRLRFAVKKVEQTGKSGRNTVSKKIRVYGSDRDNPSKTMVVEGTDLLIATGRTSNAFSLDVGKAGIEVNKEGFIQTNEFMETNVPGVWAFGDIAGKYLFKHSANLEAEYVLQNILNTAKKFAVDYTAMPHAVFSFPQVAGVGATEQDLKANGTDYLVGKYEYKNTGMGEAMAEENGFVKFLTDYDGKILGCHILGPEASILLHEVLVCMKKGTGNVKDLLDTVHVHPALSEVVQRAAGEV